MIKLLVFFKNIDAGTGSSLESLLEVRKLFKKNRLKIKVLVLEPPLYRKVKILECQFYYKKKKFNGPYKFKHVFDIFKEIVWFRRQVNNFKPDLVISEDLHAISITEIAKFIYSLKYRTINEIHNNLEMVISYKIPKTLQNIVKKAVQIILKRSFMVTTVSDGLSNGIKNYFRLKKIPRTILSSLPSRYKLRNGNFVKNNKNIVICVARLDSQKDHKTLFNAFRLVLNIVPNAKLWIVGDGPLKLSLQKLSRTLKINKNIKFYGWIQNPIKLIDQSNVLVLPTKWEGFGLVILEAMSRGVPVIASACDYGPSEILGNGKYGILTPVGNESCLAKAMTKLLLDRKLSKKYSNLGMKRYKKYSHKESIDQYKNIILSAT